MVRAAAAEIDPSQPDSLTYFGVKIESELLRLNGRVADTTSNDRVVEAARLMDQMLTHLGALEPRPGTWLERLLGRGGEPEARVRDAEIAIDQLAAQLEAACNPLLTEALTLERLTDAIREQVRRFAACMEAGKQALARFAPGSGPHHELHHRLVDMSTSRTVALQSLATIQVMGHNRRQLLDRIEFLLNRALPLWHREVDHCLGRSGPEARQALAEAHRRLVEALEQT